MNYVELHLGDWAKAVSHLSLTEEAVYLRLLRRYYTDEKPLPLEVAACQRLAGARSKEERQAVVEVLREFFVLSEDGHRNKRADEEIAKYLEGEPEREAKKASERERQRKTREDRRRLFDELRALGVVPEYNATTTELRALLSRHVTRDITSTDDVRARDDTATQSPDTSNQEPKIKSKGARAAPLVVPEWLPSEVWDKWHRYRNNGKKWTHDARALSLRTLTELHAAGHDPMAVVDQSIERGWTGLFAIKEFPNANRTTGGNLSAVEKVRAANAANAAARAAAVRAAEYDELPAEPYAPFLEGQYARVG